MSKTATAHLIANLNPPGGGAWQGAVQNVKTKEWFVIHARASFTGGAKEDVLLYRFNAKGQYQDKMILVDAGHPYGFGVSDTNVIWVTWDLSTNDVTTIPYAPGATMRKSSADREDTYSDGSTQVSFSSDRKTVVVAENLGGGKWRFTRHRKDNLFTGTFKPYGRSITRKTPSGTWFQGFATEGRHIYLCFGKVDKKAWIERWDTLSHNGPAVRDITHLGPFKGESRHDLGREPEGLDSIPGGIVVSVKVFHGSKRRLRLFQIDNF